MTDAYKFALKLADQMSDVSHDMTRSELECFAFKQLEEAKERGELTLIDQSMVEGALTWHDHLDVLDSLNLVLLEDGDSFFTISYPAATKYLERVGVII